jgi:hypothetical protein
MLVTDDTFVPNWIMVKCARLVGAVRGAAFLVRRGEHGCDTLELFNYFPRPAGDGGDVTAERVADALRRFVLPCLVEDREAVIEVPELSSAGVGTYVLVFLMRDATGVRGVAALVVECRARSEAERRHAMLQDVMGGPPAPPASMILPRAAAPSDGGATTPEPMS